MKRLGKRPRIRMERRKKEDEIDVEDGMGLRFGRLKVYEEELRHLF